MADRIQSRIATGIHSKRDESISAVAKRFGINSPVKGEHVNSHIYELTKYSGDLIIATPPNLFMELVEQHICHFGNDFALINSIQGNTCSVSSAFSNDCLKNLKYVKNRFRHVYELSRTIRGKKISIDISLNGKSVNIDTPQCIFGSLFHQNPPLWKVAKKNRPAFITSWLDDRLNEALVFSDVVNYKSTVTFEDKKELRACLEDMLKSTGGLFVMKASGEDYPTGGGRQTELVNKRKDLVKLVEKIHRDYSYGVQLSFYNFTPPLLLQINDKSYIIQVRPQYDINGRLAYLALKSGEKGFSLKAKSDREIVNYLSEGNILRLSSLPLRRLVSAYNTSHGSRKVFIQVINGDCFDYQGSGHEKGIEDAIIICKGSRYRIKTDMRMFYRDHVKDLSLRIAARLLDLYDGYENKVFGKQ